MSVCPVCETNCQEGAQYCSECGFNDEQGIARPIATLEEARHRLEFIIKPHRNMWERQKAEKAIKEADVRVAAAKAAEEAAVKATQEAAAREAAANAAEKALEAWETRRELDAGETIETQTTQTDVNTKTTAPELIPGDIISFGGYDWRVLTVAEIPDQGHRAFLLSEEILEEREYDTEWKWSKVFRNKTITWEHSTLRRYLNEDFYNSFSEDDRSRILETFLENKDNPEKSSFFGSTGGNSTFDMIFLLSIDEIMEYHEASKRTELWCEGKPPYKTLWWLRSPGHNNIFAAFVTDYDRRVNLMGSDVDKPLGIRPALWLQL
ncbi:MAG: DUF6273 domain-containing protein [Defluviitaleaceae bacterium]|nr:DUF6273 domain-containing protein [Defluviitaleaceae bacterium]